MTFLESLVILIIIEVLTLLFVVRHYQSRQATALEQHTKIREAQFYMSLKKQRGELHQMPELPGGAKAWLKQQIRDGVGVNIAFEDTHMQTLKIDNLPVLALYTEDEGVLIVAPYSEKELKGHLSDQSKSSGALGQYQGSSRVLQMIKKPKFSVVRAVWQNPMFDLEAAKAGDELGINWKNTEKLIFVMGQV